jgi:hypothetical protein
MCLHLPDDGVVMIEGPPNLWEYFTVMVIGGSDIDTKRLLFKDSKCLVCNIGPKCVEKEGGPIVGDVDAANWSVP